MSLGNTIKNDINVTAFGKTVKTAFWIAGGYVIATISAYVANYHWKASLVALGVPSIVNLLLYAAAQFFDKTTPNFPSSSPLVRSTTTVTGL